MGCPILSRLLRKGGNRKFAILRLLSDVFFHQLRESRHYVDGQREDDGSVLLYTDLSQGLQVAQLHRGGFRGENVGSLSQSLRGAEFTFGVDDLRTLLALRLSL